MKGCERRVRRTGRCRPSAEDRAFGIGNEDLDFSNPRCVAEIVEAITRETLDLVLVKEPDGTVEVRPDHDASKSNR